MADIKRKRIDVKDEENIIISSIVSTDFLKEIIDIARPELFSIPHSKIVFKWVKEYFDKYKEAPGTNINDLYEIYKEKINDNDASSIGKFLETLEGKYDDVFNYKFATDKAIQYFRRKNFLDISQRLKSLVETGRIDEADQELTKFKKVSKQTSRWINPNDPEYAKKVYDNDEKDRLIKLPGSLGDLLGWWERGWLVMGQGVYGSGKSQFLKEIEVLAMRERLRVAEINLEMGDKLVSKRYYRKIANRSEKKTQFLYPVFDCYWNQIDDCTIKERRNKVRLMGEDDPKPKFHNAPVDYRPCSICRFKDQKYHPATWFEILNRELLETDYLENRLNDFTKSYGDVYRLMCYPKYTANLSDINRDLELLEYTEDFIPDVIVIDYADILRPEDGSMHDNEESRINQTWMALSQLAQRKHCLVVTVSQVKLEVLKERKKHGKMGDASGSARAKYAHPEIAFAFMQTNDEKEQGIVRFNAIKLRDDYFNESEEVLVLQDLSLSNALIDSEYLKPKKK